MKIHRRVLEILSLLYPHYPKNNANINSTIDPGVQNNIAIRDSISSLLAIYIIRSRVAAFQLPKPPAGPPKFKKVLIFNTRGAPELENLTHARCLILRCAHHFFIDFHVFSLISIGAI